MTTLEQRSIRMDYITVSEIEVFGMEHLKEIKDGPKTFQLYSLGDERYKLFEHDYGLFEIINHYLVSSHGTPLEINARGCRE